VTGYKIFQGALVVAVAGAYGVLAFVGLLVGTFGYALKSFLGYLRTQQKYQLNLTRSLYYQNLDNNAGVLFRLVDEAEEQECREIMLAYFVLWQRAGEQGWPADRLDRQIERLLFEAAQLDVDFEIGDALEKLVRLGLAERFEGEKVRAVPMREALTRLNRSWDDFFHDPNAKPFVSRSVMASPAPKITRPINGGYKSP
jgi:hypothetical protein